MPPFNIDHEGFLRFAFMILNTRGYDEFIKCLDCSSDKDKEYIFGKMIKMFLEEKDKK